MSHRPYQGVALTETGEKMTLQLLRRHRLLETYLRERLGVPWDQVHAEADRLEHALSEDLEERIDAILGHPRTDPHGAPIPTKDGRVAARATTRLWQARPGSSVTVAEVEDEDAALLKHLAELGLVPGARVEVLAKGPFDGPLHVRVAGHEHALGEAVSRVVSVVPVRKARTRECSMAPQKTDEGAFTTPATLPPSQEERQRARSGVTGAPRRRE